jgi:hypothetical protein
MKAQTFKGFVLESLGIIDDLRLVSLGLSDEGWRVLRCRVKWDAVGQKRLDGSQPPFMQCWFYENWPHELQTDDNDTWVEYPGSELTRLYLNGEPGDVELVDAMMLKLARDNGADLLWVDLDGDWYDVATGNLLPEKLHKII